MQLVSAILLGPIQFMMIMFSTYTVETDKLAFSQQNKTGFGFVLFFVQRNEAKFDVSKGLL